VGKKDDWYRSQTTALACRHAVPSTSLTCGRKEHSWRPSTLTGPFFAFIIPEYIITDILDHDGRPGSAMVDRVVRGGARKAAYGQTYLLLTCRLLRSTTCGNSRPTPHPGLLTQLFVACGNSRRTSRPCRSQLVASVAKNIGPRCSLIFLTSGLQKLRESTAAFPTPYRARRLWKTSGIDGSLPYTQEWRAI